MKYSIVRIVIFVMLFFVFYPVFAQEQDSGQYSNFDLSVGDDKFSIPYQMDADVISMNIDKESKSLLIGIQNSGDSFSSIILDNKLINAENNQFVVLVDGVETDYESIQNNDNVTLNFFVPVDSEEIEIIGTYVVPEFPLGVLVIMSIMMIVSISIVKYKKLAFTL